MKRTMAIIVSILLLSVVLAEAAIADTVGKDYASMTIEELTEERNRLLLELTKINTARGNLMKTQSPTGSLGKIKDLFPDENFAIAVRDACGKFSIEQEVTQEDLDRVWIMNSSFVTGPIGDLTGISLLRKCNWYEFRYTGTHFPEEMKQATWLKYLYFNSSNIEEIPDWIDCLAELSTLELSYSKITTLPDSICNLPNLGRLCIDGTNVAELPANIGNLSSLKTLDISNTKITALPESIYSLSLETIRMKGLPIK